MMLLALVLPASAATWTVGTSESATHGSINAAIRGAAAGDTILVEPGTWSEVVDFGGKDVEVRSTEGADQTILDLGGRQWTAVYLGNGETNAAVLDGFTIRNAGARGVYAWNSSPTLRNLVIEGSGGSADWGGALALGYGSPVIEDVAFRDNSAYGAAHVYLEGVTATFTRCTLENGLATYGGGVLAYGSDTTFVDSVIQDNQATGAAAGLYLGWGSTLTMVNSSVNDNLASAGHGAGLYLEGGNTVTFEGGALSGNFTTDWDLLGTYGGGLYSAGYSTITLNGATLSGNQAYYGGGLFLSYDDDLVLQGALVTSNGGYYAGGVYLASGTITDTGSTWDSNTITYSGGAIYMNSATSATFTDSVFLENTGSYGYGAAVYGAYSPATYTNVTFQDNFTYYYGGGFFAESTYGTVACTGCLFLENEAYYGTGGGIYASWYTDLLLTDTTFESNSATQGGGVYVYASDLIAEGVEFRYNESTGAAGGAILAQTYYTDLGHVTLRDTLFDTNRSAAQGGAFYGQYLASLTITDSAFYANEVGEGGFGGALIHQHPLGVTLVERTTFALNSAEYGGAFYVDGGSAGGTWTNNVFMENDAGTGGAGCLINTPNQAWINNGFLGNAAVDDAGALCFVGAGVEFRNNLVAWTREGASVVGWEGEAALPQSFGYNAFYGNAEGDAGGTLAKVAAAPGSLAVDPLLADYSLDGDPEDDVLVLLRDSPLIDAGDPAILDPDASVSDIGPWGGPALPVVDADGDGYPSWLDCDDADPDAHPGGAETWYDGVNGDCLGLSDFDQDQDGLDAATYGGDDCDDLDANTTTDCGDTGSTDTDDPTPADTDGGDPQPGPAAEAGCGCASSPAGAPALLGLAGLALTVRRRRR